MPRLRVLAAVAVVPVATALAAGVASAAAPYGPRAPLNTFDAALVKGTTESQRVASYRRLHAMGVRVIRLDFRWSVLERIGPPLHRYDWVQQDREVRAIREAGLRVLGILDYGNPSYSRAGWEAYKRGQTASGPFGLGDPQYYPPDDPQSFARFASDVARRYRSDVIGWEIWNEENEGWRFWEPKEDPLGHGRLLCDADHALRRVDRGKPVVLGGLFFPPLGGLVGKRISASSG